jgi:hypothetical protein
MRNLNEKPDIKLGLDLKLDVVCKIRTKTAAYAFQAG